MRACPAQAHWLDGEAITPVLPMGGVIDRHRRHPHSGAEPVAGVASVGDAWACTNPSLGRGMGLGLSHAALLRRVLREHGDDPADLARAWEDETQRTMTPWYRSTVVTDRARLAQIDAIRAGVEVTAGPPADVASRVRAAFPVATGRDPDVFRAAIEIANCLALPSEVFERPGFAQRVLEVAGDDLAPPSSGPTRQQVLELVS